MADFSCKITIVNQTPFSLEYRSKGQVWGTWTTDPPASIAGSATSAQFQLSDNGGVAEGSEGWVSFEIKKDPGHTDPAAFPVFKMMFNDPYGSTNNYIYIESSNAENYAVWFKTKVDDAKDWSGINYINPDGHPIHVQFYIQRMV